MLTILTIFPFALTCAFGEICKLKFQWVLESTCPQVTEVLVGNHCAVSSVANSVTDDKAGYVAGWATRKCNEGVYIGI